MNNYDPYQPPLSDLSPSGKPEQRESNHSDSLAWFLASTVPASILISAIGKQNSMWQNMIADPATGWFEPMMFGVIAMAFYSVPSAMFTRGLFWMQRPWWLLIVSGITFQFGVTIFMETFFLQESSNFVKLSGILAFSYSCCIPLECLLARWNMRTLTLDQ